MKGMSKAGLGFVGLWAALLSGCSDDQPCLVCPPPPNKAPVGTLIANPTTVIEGAPVTYTVAFTPPEANDTVSCALDPEGDGSYQLPVSCTGSVQFTYQTTGTFTAAVRATDGDGASTIAIAAVTVTDAPDGVAVSEVQLLQAFRVPLDGAAVCVYQSPATTCTPGVTLTDGSGLIALALAQGIYKMRIVRDETITLDVQVDNDNASTRFVIITPFDCSENPCVDAVAEAVQLGSAPPTIATLQGVVRSLADNSPIANAQVSLSGGNATGGPYSTAFTNASGEYTLTVNVGGTAELIDALTNSTIRLVAPGFTEVNSQFSVTDVHVAGLNFFLDPNAPTPVVLFRETFESTSTTAGGWVAAGGYTQNGSQTVWHIHPSAAGAVNQLAIGTPTYVSLAPNDTSGGAVPDPIQGARAFWYGDQANGNFIGEQETSSFTQPGDGGTTLLSQLNGHSGTLTSPAISLTSATTDSVRLTFKTYWEIESVNPNNSGYDLMNVYMSLDGGNSYDLVARLNPLSDPVGLDEEERHPLPFSSIGFNAAPEWVQTETIALPGAAGRSNVRLRFEFSTEDPFFNGFRGWLIDDIVIEPGQGTLTAP